VDDLGPLSEGEWAALRSLHHAYVEMEQELAAGDVRPAVGARCT
jgi:hypothetical protein